FAADQRQDLIKLLGGLDVRQHQDFLPGLDFVRLAQESEGELRADSDSFLRIPSPARKHKFHMLRHGRPVRNVWDINWFVENPSRWLAFSFPLSLVLAGVLPL